MSDQDAPTPGSIKVPLAEARVHPGDLHDAVAHLIRDPEATAPEHWWIEEGSDQHRAMGTSFDSSTIPGAQDWVPGDSAWAAFPHPGPMPAVTRKVHPANIIEVLGPIAGRRMSELIAVLGEPAHRAEDPDSGIAIWSKRRGLTTSHLMVFHDPYEVILGDLDSMLAEQPRAVRGAMKAMMVRMAKRGIDL